VMVGRADAERALVAERDEEVEDNEVDELS
jgi:hypothetical protein